MDGNKRISFDLWLMVCSQIGRFLFFDSNFLISQRKTSSSGTCLEVPCDANGLTLKVPNETSTSSEGIGKESPGNNIQACSSADNDFPSIENKGLDVIETDFTDTNIHKLPASHNSSSHLKEINFDLSSDSGVSSKFFSVSGELESDPPETPARKTVRAWLTDPHLYKVTCFKSRAVKFR